MTKAKLNIYQRMNAVQQVVTYVKKDRPSGMKYSIVSHDVVTAKVRPELVKNGIFYYPIHLVYEQVGNRTQVQLDLKFVNIDDKEDFMLVSCIGFGIDAQDKGPGKAVSYAVKYGLLKALGLETGDDADLDNVDHEPEPVEKETKPKGSHALDTNIRPFLSAILATTSLEEFEQVKKDYKEPLAKINKEWPEYMKECQSEEQTMTYNDQIKAHKKRLQNEKDMYEQQEKDFVNPLQ